MVPDAHPSRGTTRAALRWIPLLVALHNAEEALAFRTMLPVVRARIAPALRPLVESVEYSRMLLALAVATVVPAAVVAWAWRRPASSAALWSALLVQAVMALNVLWHLGAALLLGGYAPGLVTAAAVNLPFSVYLLGRAARERWLGSAALLWLAPSALVVHGPLLLGLLALVGALTARG